MLPGSQVKADTILLEMSNPQTEQAAVDAQLQLKAAEAEYQSLRVKLESDLMNSESRRRDGHCGLQLRHNGRRIPTKRSTTSASSPVWPTSLRKVKLTNSPPETTLKISGWPTNQRAIESQMAQEQDKVDQMRTLAELKQKQLDALKVRAGIDGVLVDLPLQVGQHVLPGAMLAKVVEPNHLMATLKIAETQARDVQIGEPASIDTHNGVISGTVMRVDPAVQNGTVTVDVKLTGELPKGARPDLSVDGTIDLERMDNVLYVGRPAFGQENSTISLFKLIPDGKGPCACP